MALEDIAPRCPLPAAHDKADGPNLRDVLGPGLITGASDDDPSGIATYTKSLKA
jgi:hypothetical protein